MHVLIVSATPFEIQPVIDFFQDRRNYSAPRQVSFLITGIGSVATAYSLTKEIFKARPDIILQAGIAGSFKENSLTETVVVAEDQFGDLGVMENNRFKNIFELNLAGKNDLPFSNGSLINPYKKMLNILPLEKANAITVNEISTSEEKIFRYKQNDSLTVESMEGAAFHYVCLMEKIPFLQIRSISNDVGERDKTKWKLKEAIAVLNEKLILVTEEILKQDDHYFRV